jgi:heat-inducible transcriptional repressor
MQGNLDRQTEPVTPPVGAGLELSARERQVLEAVVRTYVETAEPAGSRSVTRRFPLGVSPATVRNTMSDLEEKGYLFHPHTSAGRVPTDLAYRLFVDQLIRPTPLPEREVDRLSAELDGMGFSAVENLLRRATRALGLLSQELGISVGPHLASAVLERLDLVRVASTKVLLLAQVRSGVVRTVYVDLNSEVPEDVLVTLTVILNERLAGLTLKEIRDTVGHRLRDAVLPGGTGTEEVLNIFIQSGAEIFDWVDVEHRTLHLGDATVLATKPEFTSGERLKSLLALMEQRDLLADAVGRHPEDRPLRVTIGCEHPQSELHDFTLVTATYQVGGLRGIIGVIGPTRMPYEKVISIVQHTSSLVNRMLQ